MRHMARAPEDMTSELHARLSKILSTSDTARRVADTDALFQPDRNCWRLETASQASVIIDADDYFRHARKAMLSARHQILLIGWDFDTRIVLDSNSESHEGPRHIGPFLSWLARRRPELEIFILKWDLGAIKLLGRGSTLFRLAHWVVQDRIHFRLDREHPAGASHHHKILVIDDSLAFCGGIDMTAERWDTREHRDEDDRRQRPTTHRDYGPWHDATMAVAGPLAKALGEHGRARWEAACGKPLPEPPAVDLDWPGTLPVMFRDQQFAIARTRGATDAQSPLREIEQLFVDMIGAAERHIYIESQYFASRIVAEALADRLQEPDPPEIVVINPKAAGGWLEEKVMGPARAVLVEHIGKHDPTGRFRIYCPVAAHGTDIYVHAKIMIVDDRILRIGSANLNNRSMGLDSECDLALCADCCDDERVNETIASLRADLLAEHLGVDQDIVEAWIARTGSLIETIEGLRGDGRTLKPYEIPDFTEAERKLAESQLLDPESADNGFEPQSRPGLLTRLGRRKRKAT
jgi:phospholipase D1/2